MYQYFEQNVNPLDIYDYTCTSDGHPQLNVIQPQYT